MGSGRQLVSWIHVDDMNGIVLWALERETVEGTYNATAIRPITNAALMTALRRAQARRLAFPLPACAVRAGAIVMGIEADLVLGGRGAVPTRLLDEGFAFTYSDLGAAVRDLLGPPPG